MSAQPVRSVLLSGVSTRSVERERAELARMAVPEHDGEFTTAAAQSTPAAWNLQRGPAETGLPAGLPAAQGGGIAVESDHERNARLVAAAQASRGPDERAFGSPATQVGGDQRLFRVGPSPSSFSASTAPAANPRICRARAPGSAAAQQRLLGSGRGGPRPRAAAGHRLLLAYGVAQR